MSDLLRAYQIKYNKPRPSIKENRSLYGWFNRNQEKYENGAMWADQIKIWEELPLFKLEAFGYRRKEIWLTNYKNLRVFQDKHKSCWPDHKEDYPLYYWAWNNRNRFASNLLDEDQEQLWLELPINLDL